MNGKKIKKILIIVLSIIIIIALTVITVKIVNKVKSDNDQKKAQQEKIEKEKDLENITIKLSSNEIKVPLNGKIQGMEVDKRDEYLEELIPSEEDEEIDEEKIIKYLKKNYLEDYTGGEISIKIDNSVNSSVLGEYNVDFTVTSAKGNTKTETLVISVENFYMPDIIIENTEITIAKGTKIDILDGVTVDSNLPKELQGKIVTIGAVDIDKVGTYTITYEYSPKKETNEKSLVRNAVKIFNVIEKLDVNLNNPYYLKETEWRSKKVVFKDGTRCEYSVVYYDNGEIVKSSDVQKGTYTVNGKNVTLDFLTSKVYIIVDSANNKFIMDPDKNSDEVIKETTNTPATSTPKNNTVTSSKPSATATNNAGETTKTPTTNKTSNVSLDDDDE